MSESIAFPLAEAVEAAPAGPVVEAHELTRRYGEGDTAVDALRGVSLDVARGKLTAVMGPSGSGKSTLMHILAALDAPTDGYVVLAGTRLGDLSDTEITKLRRQVNTDLRKLERRGLTARNRLERQIKRTRTQVERTLRQRRNRVNRVVKRNGKAAQRDLQRNAEQFGNVAADAVREVQTQVQSLV